MVLTTSLPLDESTARMRVLRTVESLGCAMLRDGVYLFPGHENNRASVRHLKAYIESAQGSAHMLIAFASDDNQEAEFKRLFDRSTRYEEVRKTIESLQVGFGISDTAAIARVVKGQREAFEKIVEIDFFGSAARTSTDEALHAIEKQVNAMLTPADADPVPRARKREAFFRKIWATRNPMLADRLASAWLIRRFIDAEATLRVAGKSEPIPGAAITFGFGGAQFGNTSKRITFEELTHYFQLDRDSAIHRIGTVVRALEGHDTVIPEATGFGTMIDGARRRTSNDYQFVAEAEKIFDMVYERYVASPATAGQRPMKAVDQ